MKILVNISKLSLPDGVVEYLKTLALEQESNVNPLCIHDYAQTNILKRMIAGLSFFTYVGTSFFCSIGNIIDTYKIVNNETSISTVKCK